MSCTNAAFALTSTSRTTPRFPRSRPASTTTVSPFLMRATVTSQDLRCQRNDLHVVAFAQLSGDRPKDARPFRIVLVLEDNGGVIVEADVRAISSTVLFRLAHDH